MANKKSRHTPIDNSRLKTTSLLNSRRKVNIKDFARPISAGAEFSEFWRQGIPMILAGADLRRLAQAIAVAHQRKKQVILGMGAHPIKVGLSPLIIDFIKRGVITAIAGNGAVAIHDFEIALAGSTSEEVESALEDGSFGAALETGDAFKEIAEICADEEIGFGEALGELINSRKLPHRNLSLFAQARKLGIPATVHIAIGTDIVHIHPGLNGAGLGAGSLRDFKIFAQAVSRLERGVFINLGSAVIMPEVFLKAVSLGRNLGHPLKKFTAANLDFINQYRPNLNVLKRPTSKGGTAINLIGHHEIMLPLLFAGVLLEQGGKK